MSELPQPDWSQSPGYATHHGFNPNGDGRWLELTEPMYTRRAITAVDVDWWQVAQDPSGLTLPIGIDWRTTLQQRPKVRT
jgi:hypothetical protein